MVGEIVVDEHLVDVEYRFDSSPSLYGIKPDAEQNTIRWHINLPERHGVERYPFGKETTLTLICEKRDSPHDEPVVTITSDKPVTVELFWDNDTKRKTLTID